MEQTLGDRMKQWENAYRSVVEPHSYLMLRLDGRAFHTYTRGLSRPFDAELVAAMDATMVALCEEIDGVRLAYCQSDEISLVVTDWRHGAPTPGNPTGLRLSEPWLGGVVAKILSISAAVASVEFNDVRVGQSQRAGAVFDARLWTFPGDEQGQAEVGNYLLWRQRDAIKNSVTMAASAVFSRRRLHGVNSEEKHRLLVEAGKPWEGLPAGYRQGRVAVRRPQVAAVTYVDKRDGAEKTIEVERHPFVIEDAPLVGDWIADHIPEPPNREEG